MSCDNLISNLASCNCSYEPCGRKGKCCQCLAYHQRLGELPACYFSAAQEKTFDRSISYFIKCNH